MVGDKGWNATIAVISPLLANIYLHYVFDLWVEAWRSKLALGEVIVVRYADDLVVGFEHRGDAERFLEEFRERLAKFGLELHPEKTRLIRFGRFARSQRQERGEGEPETFAFLGFTHRCGANEKGHFKVERQTIRKRLEAKLLGRMHESVRHTGEWLERVLLGFYQYHGVPGNQKSLGLFRERVSRHWVSAARFSRLCHRWLLRPRVFHPLPGIRFDTRYSRQEPCAVIPLARICAGGGQ